MWAWLRKPTPENRLNSLLRNHWSPVVLNARQFAHQYHGDQKYSEEFPYTMHLQAVESVLLRFGVIDPELRAAAWLHDVLEDTTATHEMLAIYFSERIVAIVDAVTEPKGGNRKWRHDMTYPKIAQSDDFILIKLADRIANVEASGTKFQMYRKEYKYFEESLDSCEDRPCGEEREAIVGMWLYLDSLMMEDE